MEITCVHWQIMNTENVEFKCDEYKWDKFSFIKEGNSSICVLDTVFSEVNLSQKNKYCMSP
jgi:hypothetical protein